MNRKRVILNTLLFIGAENIDTYQEDIDNQAPERAFLDGGSAPPRLDEDTPAVVAMVAVAVAEVCGTCEILKGWVSSINAGKMLLPFLWVRIYRLEVELPRRVS
jgi:hypothetical protein